MPSLQKVIERLEIQLIEAAANTTVDPLTGEMDWSACDNLRNQIQAFENENVDRTAAARMKLADYPEPLRQQAEQAGMQAFADTHERPENICEAWEYALDHADLLASLNDTPYSTPRAPVPNYV